MFSLFRLPNLCKPNGLAKSSLTALAVSSFAGIYAPQTLANTVADECGYTLSSGITTSTRFGYIAWVDVNNVSGDPANEFEVLLDIGNTELHVGIKADFEEAGDGDYWVTQPRWWRHKKDIDVGDSYRFRFRGRPRLDYVAPYLVSVNGMPCDTEAPTITLATSDSFVTGASELTLSASASDNSAVMKVVFERDGEVIGVDTEAPYELPVSIDASLNGYQLYTATAYDPSGNTAVSAPSRVFVSVGDKFLGTAPGGPEDYTDLLTYFNQLTPENAGKWGAVEVERDVMNWETLDTAYQFAADHGIDFKFHTLIWGQQQPEWLDALSPAEQLEEIEEWMSLVAARYPDITMIEVVNEPLHAPPSYAEALGGAGESGWDWVIKSFELARTYFPESQLILNDYQILILQSFTADYLAIINILQAEGLIDAIGLQSHFLERAELPIVAENLDTLAATGLPLYISEFDLNVADDALHANKFRDLFTLFWEHPAVVGVTHWGHLEGSVWREDAYLINQDGSQRPALDWLVCYLAGNTGCTVPEYVPSGWQGDEFGLTLQAEEYDAGQGVLAVGDTLAYTDDGDWIVYYGVEFLAGWDTFWVNYAKGNPETGSISVHLDDPENPAVLTVELPPTAGWGTLEEIEAPLVVGDTTHDVYIRFNDTFGVANVDYVRFGKPGQPSNLGPNILENGSFDYGDYWWYSWDIAPVHTTDVFYSGPGSLFIPNVNGNSTAATNLLESVQTAQPGTNYQVDFFTTIEGSASADVRLIAVITCDGVTSYPWVVPNATVNEGEWTAMSGVLEVPSCADLSQLQIVVQGPGAGVDFYVDEVSVKEILSDSVINIFPNGDFEEGNTFGWYTWNDGTIGLSTELVYNGENALEVSQGANGSPAAYNWLSVIEPGQSYSISMAASQIGAESADLNIALAVKCAEDAGASYPWITNPLAVAEGTWEVLEGTIDVPDCELDQYQIHLQGPTGINIYVDDVIVTPL